MRYVLLFLYQMQPNLKPIEILVYTQPRPNEAPNNNPSKLPMQPDDKHATYPLFRLISFACLSLKPLHKALISGYGLFISSNACGITRTAHELTLAFWPALKQRQKYPGCLGSMQNAQTDRLGLASVQVVNQRSVIKLAYVGIFQVVITYQSRLWCRFGTSHAASSQPLSWPLL